MRVMRQTYKQLEDRIAELERRVRELEAQPREQHTHFHSYPPVYQQPIQSPPQPFTFPMPSIGDPIPNPLMPPWGSAGTGWIPDTNGTITWDGGKH